MIAYKYLYKNSAKCVYCQREAELFDHIMPKRVLAKYPYLRFSGDMLVLVPACNRCNLLASNRVFTSLEMKLYTIASEILAMNLRKFYASKYSAGKAELSPHKLREAS